MVIPAIDAPGRRIRSTATPQDPEALAVKLHTLWQGRKFPVKYRDPLTGEWVASWPERKSLPEINKIEEGYRELGDLQGFQREYMCEATASEDQRFNSDHMRAEPIARTYQATYAVYDPARTVNELSAHTGKVVFSWAGHRLIVWESSGNFWKPDEIVHDIFQTDEKYNPIYIGVEQDGLHEFIMQPIRAQAMQRGRPVPIKALKAPKGKLNFIQGLQPFFQAHEVVFAPDLSFHSEAIKQFLSFPTGRIDVPNALAYALTMRVGLPMFDNFGDIHVSTNLRPDFRSPYFLAANSNGQHVTAVLAQYVRGQFHILNDWILDGDAGTVLADIVTAAKLEAMKPVKLIIPQEHFGTHDAIGMKPAALKLGLRAFKGGKAQAGLEEVRRLLSTSAHGQPSLSISPAASWTLRAFAGGYARPVTKEGGLAAEPLPGPYATLMVGLQSLVGFSMVEGEDSNVRFAKTNDGTSYITAKR